MNIALFSSAFHPSLGGVEELCRQLAHELIRQGHSVIIVTNRWPRSLPAEELYEGILIYRLPFRMPEPMLKARISFALTYRQIRRKLFGILRRHAIDVLHVQCVSSNAHYAVEAKEALSLPLVVTLQGELTMDANQIFERSELARKTLRRALDAADRITACSSKTLSDAEAFYGEAFGARASVVFNGASVEEFATALPYSHWRPYIFAIGRLVPQKGFDVFLRAFARSGIETHDVLLAGDGPEREPLERLASELGASEHVKFLGRAGRDQVPSLFKGSDLFVLPSRADEGLPVVCAEAMAAGKPVIATRSGGAPEAVIDGECGLIVEKESVEGLAGAIARLCDSSADQEKFGDAGQRRAREFSWKTITGKYEEVYNGCGPGFSLSKPVEKAATSPGSLVPRRQPGR